MKCVMNIRISKFVKLIKGILQQRINHLQANNFWKILIYF